MNASLPNWIRQSMVKINQHSINITDFKTDNLIGNDPKAAHEPTVWAKLSHANRAYVEIADLDKFTSAQIKVGNTSYATVSKVSDNAYSAKFTDNSVKAIAP